MTDLATALLPVLQRSLEARFNVFDVMHHGTHEKQISNVFRWLLETEGNHHLGDTFLRIFIDEVNRGLVGREPFAPEAYLVLQEVNTSDGGNGEDIADLVLTNDDAVIVVENYFTSDGRPQLRRLLEIQPALWPTRCGCPVVPRSGQLVADDGVGERVSCHVRQVAGQAAPCG